MTVLFGGLTGVLLASPPLDFHVIDSYFVVAHFHYILFNTVVFAMFAGFYHWWPKLVSRMLNESWPSCIRVLFFGFHGTFLVQHWPGAADMARRYAGPHYAGSRVEEHRNKPALSPERWEE